MWLDENTDEPDPKKESGMGDESTIKERAVETLVDYIRCLFGPDAAEELDWELVESSVTNAINNMCFEIEMLDIDDV